jgi:adenylate kinase
VDSEPAPGAVVFITGVAAVGKTSVARELERRGLGRRLSIGELVLDQARRLQPGLTHDQLRQEPDLYAPLPVVGSAIGELCRLVEKERGFQTLIVESHAVTAESYGSRVTVFSHEDLRRLAFDVIVLLECGESTIASRWRRRSIVMPVPTNLRIMIDMQRAVGVAYAAAVGCPLYAVAAEASVESVATQIEKLLNQWIYPGASRSG